MVGRTACFGRPRKHQGGWESANSRIYLSMETLAFWRRLRSEREFPSDNAVAVFLLERNKTLTELQATQETGMLNWNYLYITRLSGNHKP